MIEIFAKLVPQELLNRSGKVFYSGRTAFSNPSNIYLLGYNPGSDKAATDEGCISKEMEKLMYRTPALYSSYLDASWGGKPPGKARMQPRIVHMLKLLQLDPRQVPSSNLIFVRSRNVRSLKSEARELIDLCWPFHAAVIKKLKARIILCLGEATRNAVMEKISANKPRGIFQEQYLGRSWKSKAYSNEAGTIVVGLSHPSIANWIDPKADPTPLVQAMIEGKAYWSDKT